MKLDVEERSCDLRFRTRRAFYASTKSQAIGLKLWYHGLPDDQFPTKELEAPRMFNVSIEHFVICALNSQNR